MLLAGKGAIYIRIKLQLRRVGDHCHHIVERDLALAVGIEGELAQFVARGLAVAALTNDINTARASAAIRRLDARNSSSISRAEVALGVGISADRDRGLGALARPSQRRFRPQLAGLDHDAAILYRQIGQRVDSASKTTGAGAHANGAAATEHRDGHGFVDQPRRFGRQFVAVEPPQRAGVVGIVDGDELSAEPSRLVDEAMTIPMFGGRRAIRVRAGSRSFAGGVDTLADMPLKDCRIVIEAGELRPESPLRKACERAKTAVAIACYPDTERDLAKLIDEELRASNLRIAADARAVLMSLLGGDRQASRNELRKLTLYSHGKGEIALDDVMTVVSDASELKLDPIVDGAFAGKPDLVESEFAKAMVAGTYPGVIISAAQRQAAWLHKSALAVAEGTPVSSLLESGYPRLHFSRKGAVEIALRNFSAARLAAIIDQLGTAALDMRKQATLASAIGLRTLLSIAANAKRRG